jgi:recombination DNA repair RAD52 pathway protein
MKTTEIMKAQQPERLKEVIEQKLNPNWIKQRKGRGGMMLDYLEGHRVISILNDATDYKWSFEIISKETISPKKGKEFIEVLGKLTIPGVGVKQAYGTKELYGDQSQAAKAATTDALKKAASMAGVGLELWSDDEPANDYNNNSNGNSNYNNNGNGASNGNSNYNNNNSQSNSNNSSKSSNNGSSTKTWAQPEIVKAANALKEHKKALGIKKNKELNSYVDEWSDGELSSWSDITPANIQDFNKWLENNKIQKLSA